MKNLFRLLTYIKNYKGFAGLNVLFNLLTSVFNIFSLAMVIPILELLFTKNNNDYEQVLALGEPELGFSGQQVMAYFNYYFSQVILDPERGKTYALVAVCGLAIIVFFLKNLSRYLALYFAAPMRNGIMYDIRLNIYRKILRLPMSYFTDEKKGDILSRISHGAQEIEWTVLCSLEMILRDPVTLIIFLIGLIGISPGLTLYIFILLPLAGFFIGRVGKSLKRSSEKGQYKMGDMLSLVEETIGGIKVIQAFVNEKMFMRKFKEENGAYRSIMTRLYRKHDLASPMSEFLGVSVMCIIIYYGGSMIIESAGLPIQEREMDGNLFVLFILLFSQMIQPAKSLTTAWYNVQRGAAAEQRINDIIHAEEPIRQPDQPVAVEGFSTSIAYRDVHFEYVKGEVVLRGVNLEIKKGQMVALVGPSGSGKSTLADLLPRFYDPQKGAVEIDGKDVRTLDIHGLRGLIGVVSQQSILFNDTVYNNIAFGFEGVTQAMVEDAAKVANAHEFISTMPDGYQTNIGEGGDKLSGGQKQRISIARAVLANPPILILDEATSALDTESERLVQDALFKLMQNRTSLVIAHRLSTIQAADNIVVMENGAMVEQGTHDELIQQQGLYAKLSSLQQF